MADERISTSPIRDEATGLETMCGLLHAAGEADSNVIKDFAWRTFNLIGAYRQERAERDRLAEQVKRVRAIHVPHACPDPNCHQLGDCEQCGAPHPCATLTVALDGTEAGR